MKLKKKLAIRQHFLDSKTTKDVEMVDIINNSLWDLLVNVLTWGFIGIIIFLFIHNSDRTVENYKYPKNYKHYYTDEECIYSCYFIGNEGGYGGHKCLMDMDESLEKEYRTILQEEGRIGLWNYGIEKGFFTNDSDDYYGFFGKDYSNKIE